MPDAISVHITASSRPEADRIARALVLEKLAACVSIMPNVHSVYRWDGEVKEADEVLLIAKTRAEQFEGIRKLVKNLHSYQCPMIIAFPIAAGYQPYLDWIAQETAR